MSKINLRRRRIARLLLTLFLTMLAFTMLHRHQRVEEVGDSCELCISHIRHSGHWSAEHFSLQPCLLCELASLPFLQGAAPAFIVPIALFVLFTPRLDQRRALGVLSFIIPRAPPVFI